MAADLPIADNGLESRSFPCASDAHFAHKRTDRHVAAKRGEDVKAAGTVPRLRQNQARTTYELLSTDNTLGEDSLYWNLGYWAQARTYDAACRDLALLLSEAAALNAADEVLDVGFGFGDADLLWMERHAPRHIVGLNITPSQVETARRRAAQHCVADRVEFRTGSATSP